MSHENAKGRVFNFVFLGSTLVLAVVTAGAQPAREQPAEVDPIRCWWRTSDGAVAVGQTFSLVLTCAVVETDAVRVVPDESPLDVATVQVAPFEIVGGAHPADLRSGRRRFFQYEYMLRIIDPNVIGRDVTVPAQVLHYRVESRVQSGTLEGRDLSYVLPPLSVRVLSTVPADATDIRDASNERFGDIATLRFRQRVLGIGAVALAALGVIVLVPALVGALVGVRARAKTGLDVLPDRAVLNGVSSELTALQEEGRVEWTPELVSRALNAVRVAAAYALGRRASQRLLAAGADPPEARLVVMSGWLRRRRSAVSSPVTAVDVARELERLPLTAPHERRSLLEALHASLSALTRALYAPKPSGQTEADEAIATALGAVRQIRTGYRRPDAAVKAMWSRA